MSILFHEKTSKNFNKLQDSLRFILSFCFNFPILIGSCFWNNIPF